jgi:hypothetical protein
VEQHTISEIHIVITSHPLHLSAAYLSRTQRGGAVRDHHVSHRAQLLNDIDLTQARQAVELQHSLQDSLPAESYFLPEIHFVFKTSTSHEHAG